MEITTSLVSARLEPLAGASVTAPPNAAATQQFAALMQAPAAEPVAAAATATPSTSAPAVTGSPSVGDKIINGMQNVSSEFRETWTRVSDTLRADSPQMGMQEMLSLQLHLTQASVQYDLLGKAVSRSTQNFDQLVRVQ
jgi:type III secretion protein I